ncbi:LAFA_0F03268g1_1 [Lachancea sp. 'fantastica']|nr:LAFA_0F03268g1_1 [Lachancea sp. 'fantastica']
MDTLEEKRRKLRELRERRAQSLAPFSAGSNDDLASHLLKSEHLTKQIEMVSISTQTEEPAALETKSSDIPAILTYEQAIQTDPIDISDDSSGHHSDNMGNDSEVLTGDGERGGISDVEPELLPQLDSKPAFSRSVEPYVVESQALTLGVKSFSLLEALDKTKAALTQKELQNTEHFTISHSLGPEKMDVDAEIETKCAWVDYYLELALVVYQDSYKTSPEPSVSSSRVSIYKLSTAELVDTVEFKGQRILRGKFVRRTRSTVTSALLTCYNGKTILYEARGITDPNQNLSIERNLIVRNFHHYPAFALWQHHIDSPRVLVGSTDGTISDLDVLKMEVYQTTEAGTHFKISPVSSSTLLLSDDPNDDSQAPSGFRAQLDKQSRYDETAVTALVTMPQDPSVIYAGCEDGGIYKINVNSVKSGAITIDTDNNGFVPKNAGDSKDIFHSFPITGLCQCANAPNLLLSYGMDWECKLWDVLNNQLLVTIEMDYPVIYSEWMSDEENYYIFVLTPTALTVYKPMVVLESSDSGVFSWRTTGKPKEIFSIDVSHFEELTYFTSVAVFRESGKCYALLGGNGIRQICVLLNI